LKRFKEKVKRKEFELKKQEENEKQKFLNLSDKEKVKRIIIQNVESVLIAYIYFFFIL